VHVATIFQEGEPLAQLAGVHVFIYFSFFPVFFDGIAPTTEPSQ